MPDNQVALSRMSRATSSSLSKATRQNVPPFLQKLYEMVSDSATDNLIRWSENGDSFFVLDHERVAHDVLPRWFKHNNFASFVRQLNMYGFHKIPHLQQGVLKSESETEICNFEHPNFRRGQPDLLCLITRKKQAQERQNEDSLGEKDVNTPGPVGGFAAGSLVDINSIINGIAAIKRHQATISADLNDLKASNQHLWQEALDARERHQKQQDTINRILKFLAGVFGNSTAHKGSPVHDSSHASILRKRQRLMIEGAAQSVKDKPPDRDEMMGETTDEGTPADRFVEVSPSPIPSKAPSALPETPEPQNPAPQYQLEPPPIAADIVMGGSFANQQPFIPFSTTTFPQPDSDHSAVTAPYIRTNDSITPTALTSSTPSPREELLQSIVNSPGAMQRLLNLLSFQQHQQNVPMPPPLDLNDPKADSTGYVDNVYNDPYAPQPIQQPPFSDSTLPAPTNFDLVGPDPHTMSLLHPDDISGSIPFEPYIETANKLKKTSDASSVIAEHVSKMDSSIDSLMKHLGLDPQQLDSMRDDDFIATGGGDDGEEEVNEALFNHDQVERQSNASEASTNGANTNAITADSPAVPTSITPIPAAGINTSVTTNPAGIPFQPTVPEFDFNAFLNELAKQNGETPNGPGFGDYKPSDHTLDALMGANTVNGNTTTSPQLSAFVDEIASQSGHSDISASPPRTRSGRTASIVSDGLDSPIAVNPSLPDIGADTNKKSRMEGTGARKRKPEIDADVDLPADSTATTTSGTRTQTKARRKR